jgi:uncharacterized surface protein with fasciclin (FAS1) repeats
VSADGRRQTADSRTKELSTKYEDQRPKSKVKKILTKYEIQVSFPFRIFIEFETNPHPKKGRGKMKKVFFMLLFAAASIAIANQSASAQMMSNGSKDMNPMVGGAPMMRTMDIIDNAVNSADHTTLVAAVKAADLVATLKSKGPFTVFAPTNAAFDKLPAGTVESLVKPENKATLTKILTYHVLAGKFDSNAIAKRIKAGGGTASFKTVSGDTLTARMDGNRLVLRDEKGGTSSVSIANVYQSNGVIHVVDTVLLPN